MRIQQAQSSGWDRMESDIDHGFTWPETGIQAWELNPGPIKINSCMVWGSNPGHAKYCNGINHDVQNNVITWIANNM